MENMKKVLIRTLIVVAAGAFTAVLAVILFVVAGRADLPLLWVLIGIFGAIMVVSAATIDTGLLKERIRPGPGGVDGQVVIILKLLVWATLLFAAADVGRINLSDTVPLPLQVAGLVGFGGGFGLALWAMTVNPFFSTVIRLQEDRGHRLVTAGPYRRVRHPGYTGILIGVLSLPLALGSWLSGPPMVVFALLILRRTAREDRFLREKLDGYDAYARSVRHRLVPRVW